MDKIRVLRIIGQCKSGGTESIALNYYENIDHDKVAMDFLFYGDSLPRFNEILEANGDKVINVTDYTTSISQSIKDISKVVKEGSYDIVHSDLNTLNVFPMLAAKLGGANIRIAANHSTANLKHETKKSIIKYLIRPSVKWEATNYAACSKHAAIWCFGDKVYKEGKVKIIRNAIDLDKFQYSDDLRNKVRNQMNWNNKFVIGHVGRFTEQKNHKFMIEIFKEIHDKCPNAILALIGEGHLLEETKKQVDSLELTDSVQFLKTRFDVNELMCGMDVFLFPSLYEGLGVVALEAQATGLECVVSDEVPSEVKATDLVDSISLKDDVSKWSEIVMKYNNNYKRFNRHTELANAGYDIKKAAKDLECYYSELITGGGRPIK